MKSKLAIAILASMAGACSEDTAPVRFLVRIENVSPAGLVTTSSVSLDVDVAPGAYVVTSDAEPLFTVGQVDRRLGLESLAEEGQPLALANALVDQGYAAGTFDLADVTYQQGAIARGEAFAFFVEARPGERLHLASMFGLSNDHFFATRTGGIALFSSGQPRTADVTMDMAHFDLGTEVDEPFGEGAGQPAIGGVGAGVDERVPVTEVSTAPSADQVLRVTVAPAP